MGVGGCSKDWEKRLWPIAGTSSSEMKLATLELSKCFLLKPLSFISTPYDRWKLFLGMFYEIKLIGLRIVSLHDYDDNNCHHKINVLITSGEFQVPVELSTVAVAQENERIIL